MHNELADVFHLRLGQYIYNEPLMIFVYFLQVYQTDFFQLVDIHD